MIRQGPAQPMVRQRHGVWLRAWAPRVLALFICLLSFTGLFTPGQAAPVPTFLTLDMNPPGWNDGDVRYHVMPHPNNASIMTLTRQVRSGGIWGQNWIIVPYLDDIETWASLSGDLVTFTIATTRTVFGRAYTRSVALKYRLQTPDPNP